MAADNSNEVEFNDAFTQVQRLDKLQSEINNSFSNLLATGENGLLEFENAFNNLTSVFYEIYADLTEDEIKQSKKLQGMVKQALKFAHPIKSRSVEALGGVASSFYVDDKCLELLQNLLSEFRAQISNFKKKHGYSNPTKESSKRAMMR